MFAPVYLDHNATTALNPAVLEAMLPWFSGQFGNASSRHEYGRAARRAIDEARSKVAAAVGAHPTEIVLTGGGTEANNLFIKGAAACSKPGLLAVGETEHPSVLKPAEQLVRRGWQLQKLSVDGEGRIDTDVFGALIQQKPKLVSLMLANNETGVLQDIESLACQAKTSGAWFHTDAVQAVGKIPVNFRLLNAAGVHALTLSAHKIGGPKGVGALVLDKRVEVEPLIAGGGQERGLRSGTENVAAIVGFGVACELAVDGLAESAGKLSVLRKRLEQGLSALGATVFGAGAGRLPNTVYFALPNLDGETLVGLLDREAYAVASGSACSSSSPGTSHVLRAMGVSPELARGAVRISLGADNTMEQIKGFLLTLQKTLEKMQRLAAIAV